MHLFLFTPEHAALVGLRTKSKSKRVKVKRNGVVSSSQHTAKRTGRLREVLAQCILGSSKLCPTPEYWRDNCIRFTLLISLPSSCFYNEKPLKMKNRMNTQYVIRQLTSLCRHRQVSWLREGLAGGPAGGGELHLGFAAAVWGRRSRAVAAFRWRLQRLERRRRRGIKRHITDQITQSDQTIRGKQWSIIYTWSMQICS